MNTLRMVVVSTGLVVLTLRGRDAFIPSHMSSREDVTSINENSTYNEKYRYALKKSLDLLWVVKCHIFEMKEYHRRLHVFEDQQIEYVHEIIDDLQWYINFVGDVITTALETPEDIKPGQRLNPVNDTVIDKMFMDWKLVKAHVYYYQPVRAQYECDKMRFLAKNIIQQLPLLWKPIRELMVELESVTPVEGASQGEEATTVEGTEQSSPQNPDA